MERAHFIHHDGKEIFQLDFTNCSLEVASWVIAEAAKKIQARPHNSVLTLTLIDGSSFDTAIANKLKQLVVGNKPFVRAAALVGLVGIQRVVYNTVTFFSKRDIKSFDNVGTAKAYLITIDSMNSSVDLARSVGG
jgi:hypothetical protein